MVNCAYKVQAGAECPWASGPSEPWQGCLCLPCFGGKCPKPQWRCGNLKILEENHVWYSSFCLFLFIIFILNGWKNVIYPIATNHVKDDTSFKDSEIYFTLDLSFQSSLLLAFKQF